ncbi:hypothetical protein M8756_13165 [Lutimaribacter sp. EGI FJ00015]|uniref:Uncharacterized protein n=1 Tax=Lutimaribacter degradans TaxID=2945989 RepID=A0ACC5ZY04_9RHOB|nr:hypothetical protein [Lutimaribacter sp. EGI FJ00013]MCM2563083.1 hypothetical protein [Lutimaribacter sp. EGI FJ00013]MCO0614262.1 hypothetical protein [Lutimaribacter sp. EGI FJ00015]
MVTAVPALAQEWPDRAGDRTIPAAQLEARLRGEVLTFHDDGRSRYFDDGRYTYTYADDGGTAYGYWEITNDSIVCVEFVHGAARCDKIVQNDKRLVLLTEAGHRFPVRSSP